MNRQDKVVIGNEVSCTYFPTSHQAMIMNGRIHDIVDSEIPYIIIIAHDSSTHMILRSEIRTLQKK